MLSHEANSFCMFDVYQNFESVNRRTNACRNRHSYFSFKPGCASVSFQVWFGEFMFNDTFQFYKNYKIARTRILTEIMDFIEALPAVDSPEALGLHPNADIT